MAKEYEQLALQFNNTEKYTLALEASEKCLEIDRENFDCWVHRAMVHYQLGKCIPALSSLHLGMQTKNISPDDKEFATKSFDTIFESEICKKVLENP